MAERERFGVDGRAVRIGVTRAVITGAVAYGALTVLVSILRPVVLDLFRSDRTPGPVALGLVAAGVGGLLGWGALRGARRVRVEGYTGDGAPGARALELARIARDDGSGDGAASRGSGPEVAGAVQLWSSDLLSGRAVDEDSADLTNGP